LENSRRNGIICFLFQRHLVEKFRTTSWNSITRVVCFISPFLVSVDCGAVDVWLIIRYVFPFLCGYLHNFKHHFCLLHSVSTF
jgi:hypothetical protein